jgi:hypothetical protein
MNNHHRRPTIHPSITYQARCLFVCLSELKEKTMMTPLRERNSNGVVPTQRRYADKRGSKPPSQSLPRNNGTSVSGLNPRDRSTSFRISKMARSIKVIDLLTVLVLFSMATTYMLHFDGGRSLEISNGLEMSMSMPTRKLSTSDISDRISPRYDGDNVNTANELDIIPVKENYEQFHETAPACRPLEDHEVTFGLAIALSENEISMVSHHCKQWGISAPISIAVWTHLSPEEVMTKMRSFQYNECQPQQMTIATLSPASQGHSREAADNTYPLNQLRNLAITGIQTTHVVYLGIEMWASIDLYDTLHTPSVVKELAKNPKLAIVLPSFEVDTQKCPSHSKCFRNIPTTFESLVVQLSERSVGIMSPRDIDLHGSTLYRSWIKQEQGELIGIDCVSSEYYEPFLAVRYCEGLPPFQEVLRHDGNNSNNNDAAMTEDEKEDAKHDLMSTWIIHLLRLGYNLKQVGGGFVVNLPPASIELKRDDDAASNININTVHHLRKTKQRERKFTRHEFLEWLDETVPDQRSVQRCDDVEA